MDLFLTFFGGKPVPPQVDNSAESSRNPRDNGNPPPPPTAPGRQFSVSTAAPPKRVTSLHHCVRSDGGLDVEKYLQRQAIAREWSLWRTSMAQNLIHGIGESLSAAVKATKKTRAPRCVYGRKDAADSELQILKPKECQWWDYYVNNYLMFEDSFMRAKFRNRFRLPYANYLDLLQWIRDDSRFARWCGEKVNRKMSSPIELLVLGSLRYLGRGWTFDDIEEQTAISREVHRTFFHVFIEFCSTSLYSRFVLTPVHLPEARSNMREYEVAGFPGCVGSTDCTHVTTERCEYRLKNNHLGAKSSHTTRTFNLTCNHRRRIIHSTHGGPGRWNDQTMVRLDQFISGIRDGLLLQDNDFKLLDYDRLGNVISVKYKGVYVIVDNGYLQWSCTVPPFTVTSDMDEIRWSKWLESMRKDVECTFGILKGRWRILKSGIRIEGVDAVDKVWLTCCALHNWLLEIDGLNAEWSEISIPGSDWEGELGDCDFEGINVRVPWSLARLSQRLDPRTLDLSGMGPGIDVSEQRMQPDQDNDTNPVGVNGVKLVKGMSLKVFRRKLVNHFKILFARNEIKWPTRRPINQMPQT